MARSDRAPTGTRRFGSGHAVDLDIGHVEPFGFADGVSQPRLDWDATRRARRSDVDYVNLIALGEVVLGFPNEYGRYTTGR